ncbi:NAD-dependent epimerase/dehydratase family protein [Thermomonospora amylolytica]|uniref:NAD-dependent epimerase/dehydratase family protein n=1 Tax=Thermomonospora amylolytica TaxID=1411117 RepID=UPI000E6D3253|nr:NAD-dependent epimerase/dehydratase family protein [Thermomonospora amylolytica]
MLVTVTGGTGFVGAHSVAAIVARGHRVRLLARDPSTVERALSPLGVDLDAVQVAAGDVRDETAVAAAVRGADAVLHAASVYSFDSRDRARIRRTNVAGTEVVLAAARRAVDGPVVHVSTFGALAPSGGRTVGAGSPVGRPREAYLASKAAAETVARRHQEQGAPVVITYPPALLGPDDPRLGDQTARIRDTLRGLMPIWPRGGFPVGDVRDTAELHATLLTAPGREGNRYFGPGRYLATRDQVRALREITGRRLPAVFAPAAALVPVGLLADLVQRAWPWHIPAPYGAIYVCARATRVGEDAPTGGIAPRPFNRTLEETVRWLYRAGHLSARQAGRPAGERQPAVRR